MARPPVLPELSTNRLRLALLDRQLLSERARLTIPEALDRVGGLQTQYAPSGYVGLWTRVAGVQRDDLTRALEERTAVQATLLRTTIHMVAARTFWRYAMGVRTARRTWWLRLQRGAVTDAEMTARADGFRSALAEGPRDIRELGPGAAGFVGDHGLWVDLVRVPPSGTWERRRADRIGLAEQWVGPPDATEPEGRLHLVRTYLGAFGPAAWADISRWAGVPVAWLREAAADLALTRARDEAGRELVDLAGATLPDPDAPCPVRFVPHWDALLLAHARRTQVLPEEYRAGVFSSRNPFSVGCVLVGGQVAATWSVRDGRVVVEPLRELAAREREEVEAERADLQAFHQ